MASALWSGLTKPSDPIGEPNATTPSAMTAPSTASAPRTKLHRFASVGLVVVGILMLVGLAAWLLVASSSLPPSRSVGWQLADGFLGTPKFDPATAQTTTVIPISVEWLTCAPQNASWLAPPRVTYTLSSVIITMHTTDAFAAITTCGGGNPDNKNDIGFTLDVGIPVAVQLSEPLGGRALFDGASSPLGARPYP